MRFNKKSSLVAAAIAAVVFLIISVIPVGAAEADCYANNTCYETIESDVYSLGDRAYIDSFGYGGRAIGKLQLESSRIQKSSYKGVDAYISSESIRLAYKYDGGFQTGVDEDWNLISSETRKIDDITLSKRIKKGAVIVQTSSDGANWVNYGEEFTDYFNKYDDTKSTIGEISVDELKVGAYYRVIVAYEMRHKVGEGDLTDLSLVPDWNFISKIPVPVGQFETRKCAEVYEFYLAYGENPIIVRDLLTRGQLENGSVVRDGFVIDLNGASDTVRVSQKGKSPAIASDKEVFCEQGDYHITIESKIGNQFEYDITVSDGTSLKQIAPQLYENKKNDKYTEDNLISGNGRFGAKSLSNVYIGQRGTNSFISAQVNGTDGYGVNSDRVELFMDLTGLEALANSGWTVEPDDWGERTNQTVGSASAYLGVIGTGALVVQTSTDGINWKSIDRGKYADGLFTTDYVTNYGTEGLVHIYSPNGEDVLRGEYIRVIFAYRLKNKELKEDIRNLEIYNIYLCNSNLDAVTFNNLTLGNGIENKYGDEGEIAVAVHKSIETLRSGDETVTGFRINTQLNPAVSYEITRNGEKITVPSDRNPEFRDAGKYEIRLTSPVGNQKRVELFVDTSSDQEALRYYFGDSFIDGKRIYSEGTYPTFEGEKSKYNISEVDSNHLPVSGVIRNISTGTEIEISSTRLKKSGTLTEPGEYEATFSVNGSSTNGVDSGDIRKFTFHFNVIEAGTAPGPQVNQRELNAYSRSMLSDSYPIYYGVTYPSALKGYITLAFASKEDAIDYQYEYEKGMVETLPDGSYRYTGSTIIGLKDRYSSLWELTDDINKYASQAVEKSYFDLSDESTYLTLNDSDIADIDNLRALELTRSVIIFAEGEKEKLTNKSESLPIISSKPYAYLAPGRDITGVTSGEYGFEFVQDIYKCDSAHVSIIDSNGAEYPIEYRKNVGDQLKSAGCPSGIITIKESNIYGDEAEYQAIYIREDEVSAELTIDSYLDGQINHTYSITEENADTVIRTEAFSISAVSDALDPTDLILITYNDKVVAYYAADQPITDVWSTPGLYSIKVVNKLGNYYIVNIEVRDSQYITLSFDGDGTEEIEDLLVQQGQTNISLPVISRDGYEFSGFKDGFGKVYFDKIPEITYEESMTLEAQWAPKKYKLIMQNQDGGDSASIDVEFGKEYDLPSVDKDGNAISGWEYEGTIVTDKIKITKDGDITLKAVMASDTGNNDSAEEKEKEKPKSKLPVVIVIMVLAVLAFRFRKLIVQKAKKAAYTNNSTDKVDVAEIFDTKEAVNYGAEIDENVEGRDDN